MMMKNQIPELECLDMEAELEEPEFALKQNMEFENSSSLQFEGAFLQSELKMREEEERKVSYEKEEISR